VQIANVPTDRRLHETTTGGAEGAAREATEGQIREFGGALQLGEKGQVSVQRTQKEITMKKSEIAKIPDFFGEEMCSIENCNGLSFRNSQWCKFHFNVEMQKKIEAREAAQEAAYRRLSHKDYAKREMRGRFQAGNRICSVCGKSGLHVVREKAKDRRPINPNNYWEVLEVICRDCKEAGR
jgi:hypothetical protein